jgi:putative hemolysin
MSPTARSSHASDFEGALDQLSIAAPFKRFIIPHNLERFYPEPESYHCPSEFAASVRNKLNVDYRVSPIDLARVPKTGPVIVVCNHPFGVLEGLILIEMLSRVRPDVKAIANSILATGFPTMRDSLILVDPFGNTAAAKANRKGVREVFSYLAGGGLLIVFPAGEVSHLQLRERRIADPCWNPNIARFIRHTQATVVPIFINGSNSVAFQVMGMIHPHLRTARLLHELVNKERKTVELRIANPISFETLQALGSDADITRYLRYRTYLLEERAEPRGEHLVARKSPRLKPIVEPAPQAAVESEIGGLPCLAENGDLEVYSARAAQIPNVLHEIGRLREVTFRQAGEGTGQPIDLDRFDSTYHHLFVWDRVHKQIAGAYRLGVTSELLPRMGLDALYTHTLFQFNRAFFDRVGPAIEMGRSFVTPEYQKQYAPLLLLWKGIGQFVSKDPSHPVLFGPVSISNDYNPVSRRLIVRYLQAQESVRDLAALVKPRRRFQTRTFGSDNEAISLMLRNTDELSSVTADIEPDGKGIPILLKQYLKLGGKLLAFNVDPIFSNALDGLILVDLRHTAPAILNRYMGPASARQFLSYHQRASLLAS